MVISVTAGKGLYSLSELQCWKHYKEFSECLFKIPFEQVAMNMESGKKVKRQGKYCYIWKG